MIRTILVDDEPNSLDATKRLLSELRNDIHIVGTATNADDAVKLIQQQQPNLDLLLLDIQMPMGDGFSVLRRLDVIDFKVIFITAFDQFALKAIKFSALDYVLKPIDRKELNHALTLLDQSRPAKPQPTIEAEFKKTLSSQSFFDKLAVPTLNDILFIPIKEIIYLESDSNYTTIFTADKKKVTSSKNLGHYQDLIEPHGFFRIHHSRVVNLSRITRFIRGRAGSVELDTGQTLEVSASRKEELLKLLHI
jgi:two-component system LytT family response regulator